MKYNILFISNSGNIGGAQICLLNILKELDPNLKPLILIPRSGEFSEKLNEINISYKIVKFRGWWYSAFRIKFLLRVLYNLLGVIKIYPIIKANNIKIVYSNTLYSPFGVIISKIYNIKHIWHIHEFTHLNHIQKFDFGKKWSLKFVVANSENIITPSNSLKFDLLKNINTQKISVIPNATEINYNSTFKFITKEINLLVVGTVIDFKNQLDAVILVIQLKKQGFKIKLRLVGSTEEKYLKTLNEVIYKNNLTKEVEFVPHNNNINYHYSWANILINCSKFETFGMTTIEAMANKIPVVSFNNDGAKEIIKNNDNGFIYNNISQLTKIVCMLQENKKLQQKITKNAFEFAEKKFSKKDFSKKINTIINNTLND